LTIKKETRVYDLEDRFVEFSCRMIDVVESLPSNRAGNYIAGQLIRSCHSPTFNYGEVQAAESRNDFIHKMGVIMPISKLTSIFVETEELIAIVAKSIGTAQKNRETQIKKNN